jgi:hypothetical protein
MLFKKCLRYIPSWEWLLLGFVVLILALYLMGHKLFGLSGLMSSAFAFGGAVVTTLLIVPVMAILSGLVATLIVPIAALFTTLFSTIVGWLAATWVGALFSPVYAMIAPMILKISPLLTMGKYGRKAYDWLDDQSWWPQKLVFTTNKRLMKLKAKKAAGKRRK